MSVIEPLGEICLFLLFLFRCFLFCFLDFLKFFHKHITDRLLVVHHTRKLESKDSFDMISGTNGLLGAADGAFIMHKKKRTDNTAVMDIVGRDQPVA